MTAITANFNDATAAKIAEFAAEEKITVSELIQQKILDWLEDQEDLRDAEAEYKEYLKNPDSFRNFKELEAKWMA